jgi:hypothetical protein
VGVGLLLKVRAFLSFQISQVISVMADSSPFGDEVEALEMASQY